MPGPDFDGPAPRVIGEEATVKVWTGTAWESRPLLAWDGEWKPVSLMRRSETAWESLP